MTKRLKSCSTSGWRVWRDLTHASQMRSSLAGLSRTCYDPLINRYWELVSRLKGIPLQSAYRDAANWLLDALRARLDRQDHVAPGRQRG